MAGRSAAPDARWTRLALSLSCVALVVLVIGIFRDLAALERLAAGETSSVSVAGNVRPATAPRLPASSAVRARLTAQVALALAIGLAIAGIASLTLRRDRRLREAAEQAVARVREEQIALEARIDERTEALGRANAELESRSAELRAFMDNAPFEIALKDREGRYLLVNRHFEELNDVRSEQLRGKLPVDFFGTHDAQRLHSNDMKVVARGQVSQVEVSHESDGVERTFLATAFPVREGTGRVTGVATVGIDVTPIKAAEAALRQVNEELEHRVDERTRELRAAQDRLVHEERLATIGRVAATMSHELRSPLASMLPTLFVLRAHLPADDARLVRYVDRLERGVLRCDRLIDELIDYTLVERIEHVATDLDAWLDAVLDDLELPEGIVLERHLDAAGLTVPLDTERLRRAFGNVWKNACQATSARGEDGASAGEAPRIVVSTTARDGRAVISVRDNGTGIAPEHHERIFEPLFSTKGFGSGLGLPTARQILERHGGGIEVESVPETGTEVVLWIPLTAGAH